MLNIYRAVIVAALTLFLCCSCLFLRYAGLAVCKADEDPGEVVFTIREYVIKGNTLLSIQDIKGRLSVFTGDCRTALDVEKARKELEEIYHKKGYPTVLVNIPEQQVEDGTIELQVIESSIGNIKVTGNQYYSTEKILADISSLESGQVLYLPALQDDLMRVNRKKDIKAAPVLMPGKELGKTDVEIKIKDKLPLHGSLELNNRATKDTSNLRLNTMLSYDNLWQKDHSISFQFQTSPKDTEEVQVIALSYVAPDFLKRDNILVLYSIWSDSETAFGEGFSVIGKGNLFGIRYIIPFKEYGRYFHNLSLGIDYKDFDEDMGFGAGEEELKTPLTYVPLSVSYNSSLPDSTGLTRFSALLNLGIRRLMTDQKEFETKRYKARGNYLYLTLGCERMQKLAADFSLFLKLGGQIANQPLISNEQYSAGGMESVRGYYENEEMGDQAFYGTIELNAPDLAFLLKLPKGLGFRPYIFYDAASLWIKKPLPGEESDVCLQGAGLGMRGNITRYIEYGIDWAIALSGTDKTDAGDKKFSFFVKYSF